MRRFLPILALLSGPILAETVAPPAELTPAELTTAELTAAVRHVHAQELDVAEVLLSGLEEAQPENAEVAFYLGQVHLARGRTEAAVRSIEHAVSLDPKSSSYWLALAEALVARIDEVAVLFKLQVANRMRVAYEQAVELDPENLAARVAVARYHAEAPPIAGGNPATAEQQLEEIGRRDPALAHVAKALIHERLGRLEEAEAELAAAVAVDPDSVVAWREAGLFHLRRERLEEAQRSFDEVVARQPDDPVALFELAGAALILSERQLARAETALQAYLLLAPGPGPRVYGEAEAPRRALVHQRLGWVYERQGRAELATRELEMAAGLGDPEAEERIDFPLVDAALVD